MNIIRYEKQTERIMIYNNQFICSYLPCYGLIKINKNVYIINDHKGFYHGLDGEIIIVKYIKENIVTLHNEHLLIGEKLNQGSIYNMLKGGRLYMKKQLWCDICSEFKIKKDLKLSYNSYLFKRKLCCKKCNLFAL